MSKYVKLAKRQNNSKRGFLIVNPYLGKHVPANPIDVFEMFNKVAELIPSDMICSKTLVIGFAETATALGAHYAIKNNTYFIHTTRENVDSSSKLYFTENHSHATEQYIVTDYFEKIMDSIERIIFIDDEITTGTTVLNAIAAISKVYGNNIKYDVVSILNGMTNEQIAAFSDKNIGIYYLEHVDNSTYEIESKLLQTDGKYRNLSKLYFNETIGFYNVKTHVGNPRFYMLGHEYALQCDDMVNELINAFDNDICKNILVIGTEEFMYPGLMFAKSLSEKCGSNVKFHATTRSPIEVADDDSYPLHKRYELKSVYDANRTTYIYDIDRYDEVFIVTESGYDGYGLSTLVNSIHNKHTRIITV